MRLSVSAFCFLFSAFCFSVFQRFSLSASPPSDIPPSPSLSLSDRLTDLHLGPFDLHPRLSAGVTYDDNILISPSHQEADFIWSLQPGVQISAGDKLALTEFRLADRDAMRLSPGNFITRSPEDWPGRFLLVDYAPKFNWFTDYSANNSVDQLLGMNALWPTGRLILGVQQGYRDERTTVIEAGRRTWQETIPTALLGGYQFSDLTSAEIRLHRTSTDYEQGTGLNGSTDWNDENWFNYHISPRVDLGAGVTLGDLQVTGANQTYEQVLARVRYRLAEKIDVGLAVGAEWRQFASGLDSLQPVFTLDASYRPNESTTLSLTGYRQDYASVYSGYDYLLTGVSAGISRRFWDRYFASLGLSYNNYAYQANATTLSAGLSDNYFSVNAGLEMKVTKHLQARLFYQFRTWESNQSAGWSDNQVGTQITLSY